MGEVKTTEAADAATVPASGRTHVLLAIDSSGSMDRLADDVRGGCNSFLDTLTVNSPDVEFLVTMLLFDSAVHEICVATPLADVPRLDGDNYQPMGMTALYDAVGRLIHKFESATVLDDGDRVMLVVSTDGRNNSSREYVATDIDRMISERLRTGRWMTAYLGAGPDAWNGGAAMGMQSVNTTADPYGTRSAYEGMAVAATSYSRGSSPAETFSLLKETAGTADSSADSSADAGAGSAGE